MPHTRSAGLGSSTCQRTPPCDSYPAERLALTARRASPRLGFDKGLTLMLQELVAVGHTLVGGCGRNISVSLLQLLQRPQLLQLLQLLQLRPHS